MEDKALFKTRDQSRIWKKYCGFLELSMSEFMDMQTTLLMNQIEIVNDSPIAKKLMPSEPTDVAQFRNTVPLTTWDDYAAELGTRNDENLAVKPQVWVRTSGRGGDCKWVPYTEDIIKKFGDFSIGLMIMACTNKKGEINIGPGLKILHNLPPLPYMTGLLAVTVPQLLDAKMIPPFEKYKDADFETRTKAGFQIALKSGVDILSSLTSVLVRMGEQFTDTAGKMKLNSNMLHPKIIVKLLGAVLKSRREGRPLLPKDLWPLKGLVCYGTDTKIYEQKLMYYWGKKPLEIYGATESGTVATMAWNKKDMTFVPFFCFLEFIPDEEWGKNQRDPNYQPTTVLLDEVEPGKRYEVVATSFHGMPFLRYRLGDLIKITALEDTETGIKIPQMVFESRVDGLIDIAGFSRLDEKTIWQAIANTDIKYVDWTARKEFEQEKPVVRLYIEPKEHVDINKLERLINKELSSIHPDYSDLISILGIQPLRICILPSGSFGQYYKQKKAEGADLAHLKPPHMNASDQAVQTLLGKTDQP